MKRWMTHSADARISPQRATARTRITSPFQIISHWHGSGELCLIPEGRIELMVHPGRCGPALRAAPTRLKESREEELAALVAPEVRAALARHGIELVNYAGLR